ncbi:response regulator [Vibrio palustris]|uniref:Autoinducer 1 sensor kinase/phosphatase LuxN n=1 Tax=Vibrio palustris TaxID=1918946 RepID=A0A1R4B4X8_9VIBR|nr:response regulator [Vibrio palustris]SJL83988.1 Autoinducer 1 sensor kinase/phosphatase LuxN [Vibrio palustris]
MTIAVTVCDDSKLSRKAVIRSLPEDWDINLTEATNGQEAVECFRAGKADVLFLDLTMPIMDGFEVLKTLKEEGARNYVFVISADIQPESQRRVNELGAVRFLKKPLDMNLLRSILHEVGLL